MIERAGLVALTARPSIHVWNSIDASDKFITTTAIVPSGFTNAVASNGSALDEATMRRAPGRMNFEK
jgi:hypothetical protein